MISINFMFLKYRLLVLYKLMSCFFLVVFLGNFQWAWAETQGGKPNSGSIVRYKKEMGPFRVDDKVFTIKIINMKHQNDKTHFNDTTESFSIVDQKGNIHYEKSFNIVYSNNRFERSMGIGACTIKTSGYKTLKYESGELKPVKPKGRPNAGLLLYYGFDPRAPGTGVACQLFRLKEELLVPLFLPLTVDGRIQKLDQADTPDSRVLFKNNTMRFAIWTGNFNIIVPVRVMDGLRIQNMHPVFGRNAFDVEVKKTVTEEETFVRLYNFRDFNSTPKHVIIKKDTKIEFLCAYAKILIKHSGIEDFGGIIITDGMPWLRVKINGREGFVRGYEDFESIGLPSAG